MKIFHINWSGEIGGAEKLVYWLAQYQQGVTVGYMNKKGNLGKKLEKKGIKVVEFNMRNGYDLSRFVKYLTFIRREKFEIIHHHNGTPLVRLSKLFFPGAKFVEHIHGTGGREAPKWLPLHLLLWNWFTSPFIDLFLVPSNYFKKRAIRKERIAPHKITVIYHGIEIEELEEKGKQKT